VDGTKLMPENISIGDYVLPNNVFLAPMAGVTDLPFRKICRELGAGMVVGEMMSSSGALRQSLKSRLRGVHVDEPQPRCIQIVGSDSNIMAEAARYNVDQGASIIDINMGCPAKKVCKKLAGSALLAREGRVAEILKSVVNAVDVPVTLKIRTGPDPTNRNGVAIAKIAESEGVSLLSVHGRTRACKFVGEVEFDTIRAIKAAVAIPVIANGDLNDLNNIRQVLEFTKADGVMIGRAANGAPWYPGQVAACLKSGKISQGPTIELQRKIVLKHLDAIYSFYGGYRGVRIARKHIKWYVKSFPGSPDFRAQVNCEDIPAKQLDLVSNFYLRLGEYLRAA
jgi:tRNA-dihydrouridine synthase B